MLIAIDAGHGHNTAGKRCPDDSMREHDFNSNVATKVCNILNMNGIETYRSDDITGNTDVPLKTRTNNINSKNAKICVSIHANAFNGVWGEQNGIETYIIARGGQAEKLANIIQTKLIENTGRRDRGVKVANLHMCRETKMPAILCECGFMDNLEEAELLKTEDYRNKCAEAIANGILEYMNINTSSSIIEESKIIEEVKGENEVNIKKYKNGSTEETVYADTACSKVIGSLSKYEECECLDVDGGMALVRYKLTDTKEHREAGHVKVGYVKYLDGIQ